MSEPYEAPEVTAIGRPPSIFNYPSFKEEVHEPQCACPKPECVALYLGSGPIYAVPNDDGELRSMTHGVPDVQLVTKISQEDWAALGPRAKAILEEILPEFTAKLIRASLHYGDTNADVLGPAGQFADIWRKIGPLKRAMWEGVELTREQPREILMDLVGHCLLTIGMLDRQVDRKGE